MDAINNNPSENKSQPNLFVRLWEGIKRIAKAIVDIVETGFYRVVFGKGAYQDISKMEEMVRSPINDVDISKIKKEEKAKEKEIKIELKKIEKEIEEEFKNGAPKEEIKGELKIEANPKDLEYQAEFDESIKDSQPFNAILKQMGYEYENNPDKPGIITITKTNEEFNKIGKWDIRLSDLTKEPIEFNNLFKPFDCNNDFKDYNNIKRFIETPDILRVNVAIIAAGLQQMLNDGKETSFTFNAYKQEMKMEIKHTPEKDFANIITADNETFTAFQPEGPKAFVVNPINKINDKIQGSVLANEALKLAKEFEHQQTLAYKTERAETFTNPERNAWQDQEDKIFGDLNELTENNLDEIVIERPDARNEIEEDYYGR